MIKVVIVLAGVNVETICGDWRHALRVVTRRCTQFENARVTVSKGAYATWAHVNITVPGVS